MDMLNSLLAQAAAHNTPDVTSLKQDAAAQAAARKRVELGGTKPAPTADEMYPAIAGVRTDAGASSAGELETDLRTMMPWDLSAKYGAETASGLINSRAAADQKVFIDRTAFRDWEGTAADTVSGIGLGAANMVGGLGALGVGMVNRDAGLWAAGKLDELNTAVRDGQTSALQGRRRINEANDFMDERDSTKEYEEDLKNGSSSLSAGTNRVLRDAGSAIMNALRNPMVATDGVAQGVGSILPIGRVASVTSAIGMKALETGVKSGVLSKATAASLEKAGEKWGTAAMIGSMEAGGAYQQSVNEVMGMNPADLMKTSEDFRSLVQEGIDPIEAQKIIASKTALTSAAITAPGAIAAGRLVAGFEKTPFKVGSIGAAGANLTKETLEEGIQGGISQGASNIAGQAYIDKNRTLTEGVGKQIGTGALYGFGAAGVMQAPGVTGKAAKAAAGGVLSGALGVVDKVFPAKPTQEKAEPIVPTTSLPVAAKQATDLATAAPAAVEQIKAAIEAAPVEESIKTEQKSYLDQLVQSFTYSPDSFATSNAARGGKLDAELGTKLAKANNFADAFEITAQHVFANIENMAPESKIAHVLQLSEMLQEINGKMADPAMQSLIEAIPDESDAGAFLAGLQQTYDNVENSREVANVVEQIAQVMNAVPAPTAVTAENSAEVVARATHAPATLAHNVVQDTLELARSGQITLSPAQLTRLETTEALTKTIAAVGSGIALPAAIAAVTNQVALNKGMEDGQKYPSITEHFNEISTALVSGNTKQAVENTTALRNLAQTLVNKVNALNKNIADPKAGPVKYENWVPTKNAWMTAEKPLFANNSKASIAFNKQIRLEAELAVSSYLALTEKFPSLVPNNVVPPVMPADAQARGTDAAQRRAATAAAAQSSAGAALVTEVVGETVESLKKKLTNANKRITTAKKKVAELEAVQNPSEKQVAALTKAKEKLATEVATQAQIKKDYETARNDAKKATPPLTPSGQTSLPLFDAESDAAGTAEINKANAVEVNGKKYDLRKEVSASELATLSKGEADALNVLLNAVMDKRGYQNTPLFLQLNAEMTRLEDAAAKAIADEEAAALAAEVTKKKTPPATPTPSTPAVGIPVARLTDAVLQRELFALAKVQDGISTPRYAELYYETERRQQAVEKAKLTEGQRAKEYDLVVALTKAMGIPLKVTSIGELEATFNPGGLLGGMYRAMGQVMAVSNTVVGKERMTVLLHELGHYITFAKLGEFLKLSPQVVQEMSDAQVQAAMQKMNPAIAAEYAAWMEERKDITRFNEFGEPRVHLPRSAMSRIFFETVTENDTPEKLSVRSRNSTFNEWIADNIGKALENNAKSQSVIGAFFDSIADAFRKMYAKLTGTPELAEFLPAASVQEWIDSMLTLVPDSVVTPVSATPQEGTFLDRLLPASGGKPNLLKSLFKFREKNASRIAKEGTEETFGTVINALSSPEAFKNFVGEGFKRSIPSATTLGAAKTYFFNTSLDLMRPLTQGMTKYLASKVGKATETQAEFLLNASKKADAPNSPETWEKGAGAFAALLEVGKDANGNDVIMGYNHHLMTSAAIAASQWFLTAGGIGVPKYSESQVASIAGLKRKESEGIDEKPAATVSAALIRQVSSGVDYKDAIRSMANQIQNYWGLTANKDAPINRTESIALGLAAEFFGIMVHGDSETATKFTNKYFTVKDIYIDDEGNIVKVSDPSKDKGMPLSKKITKVRRYIPVKPQGVEAGISSVMDRMILEEPEGQIYFESDEVPVSNNQLRSSVPLTDAEKSSQAAQQNDVHKLNAPFVKLFEKLDLSSLIELIGTPVNDAMNVNTRASADGKNTTVSGSFNQIVDVIGQIRAEAEATGKPETEIGLKYKFESTSTNRSMMQGKYNPQSDKMMRNLITPTTATLDLTDGTDRYVWNMASSQMLGARVYANTMLQNEALAEKIFTNPDIISLVRVLEDVLMDKDVPSSTIVEALRKADATGLMEDGITPEAMHVMLDRARFNLADDAGKKAFNSRLYLEADGVANGPAGAMAMLTSYTDMANYIAKMRKAGLFIGKQNMTMNQHRQVDGVDTYANAGVETAKFTKTTLESYDKKINEYNARRANSGKGQKAGPAQLMKEQHARTLNFLETIFPSGDITYDSETKQLVIKRGLTKSPVTVTVYGSGANGIAGQITSQILDEIYNRLTEWNTASPKNLTGNADFVKLRNALSNVVHNRYVTKSFEKDGKIVMYNTIESLGTPSNFLEGTKADEFTLYGNDRDALRKNILEFFVRDMVKGITKTTGESVIENTKHLIAASQLQAIIVKHAYSQVKNRLEAEKKAANPNWTPHLDGLSQEDNRRLEKETAFLNPFIQTDNQTWDVSATELNENPTRSMASTRNRRFEMPALERGPSNPGVSVVPYLVIGMGDASGIQNLQNDPNRPKGALQVFDGVNIGLNDVLTSGSTVNKAMVSAWLSNNPLQAASETFNRVMELGDLRAALESLSPEELKPLGWSLQKYFGEEKITSFDDMLLAVSGLQSTMESSADSVEKLHNAIREVGFSADQMAGTGKSYSEEGVAGLSPDATDAEIAEAIEDSIREQWMAERPTLEDEKNPLVLAEGKATVLTVGQLTDIVSKRRDFTPENRALALSALSSEQMKNVSIVYGTAENILKGQYHQGDLKIAQGIVEGTTTGFFNPATNTLALVETASAEVISHELVHATTLAVMIAEAQGQLANKGEYGLAVSQSVEAVKQNFFGMASAGMETSVSIVNKVSQEAFNNMMAAARSALNADEATPLVQAFEQANPVEQASALNEFMSWGLTNRKNRALLKSQRVRTATQMVVKFIKTILFGKTTPPKVASDALSQLEFHTLALMQAQKDMGSLNVTAALQGSTRAHNAAYGNDANLQKIGATFYNKVGLYLNARDNVLTKARRSREVVDAAGMASDMVLLAQNAEFLETMQQQQAFIQIATSLATEASINPLVLNEAQELYTQAVTALKVESFLADPTTTDPALLDAARRKLDLLLGRAGIEVDNKGRSSLVPMFIGLGLVDPNFRAALAKIDVANRKAKVTGSFDNRITALANNAMDSLNNRLVNGKSNPRNVNDALDSLSDTLIAEANNGQNFLTTVGNGTQGAIDTVNQWVVNGLSATSEKVSAKATAIKNNSTNKAVRGIASTVSMTANIFSEVGARTNAEAMIRGINLNGMPDLVRSVVKDLTGRTEGNKGIYDLIKQASNKVSKVRQFYKEQLPSILKAGFTVAPTDAQWTALHHMGKVDIASLVQGANTAAALELIVDPAKRAAEVTRLEKEITKANPASAKRIFEKSKQLANYTNTGLPGANLLRNADAVANLIGEKGTKYVHKISEASEATVLAVDKLISLYTVDGLAVDVLKELQDIVREEPKGVNQLVGVMLAQREKDNGRRTDMTRFNAVKGYIPSTGTEGAGLKVADDTQAETLRREGYKRVGDYVGSSLMRGASMGYYFSTISGKAPYNQGIIQNARKTSGGVDAATGFAVGFPTAGRITQDTTVKRLGQVRHGETGAEALMPVHDVTGKVIAFERSIAPSELERLKPNTNAAAMLGQWMGRQAEEDLAAGVNMDAVGKAHAMWAAEPGRHNEYVNILDGSLFKNDPVMRDALKLIPEDVKKEGQRLFGNGKFMVRREMVEDLFGYRDASFGDFWTGNSRWSAETQDRVRRIAERVIGVDAMTHLVQTENKVKALVKDAKTLIVVKSVVVPAANLIANVWQLMARGVSPNAIAKGFRDKTLETDHYVKSSVRKMELQVEMMAAQNDVFRMNKLEAAIQAIDDSHRRLSIWPLIEAGEFGSISDVGISRDEILLSEGRLQEYIEAKVDKLPDAAKTLGKNFLLTKDTALFQGLQKSMEYGDFLAKAVMFDHVQSKGMNQADALGVITDEFVNYDRLPGRFRGTIENMGMAWFYNYKLRIAKIAFSMIRKDPVRTMLMLSLPIPGMELPVTENIFTKGVEGSLLYSVGPGMLFRSPGLNPWMAAMQ